MSRLAYTIEIEISALSEQVFDFCIDLRNELRWNPRAKLVEKLTAGPIETGTRFSAQWSNTRLTTVEIVQYDRPRSWESLSRSIGMAVHFRGIVTASEVGTRYTAELELKPTGIAWLLAPFVFLLMRRQEPKNMQKIKNTLESGTATSG
ncbi:MAG: SRPBCC family protein [Thermoleophilia bacterium]